MNKPQKIIVHCLVKNEERFVWYALQSVLPYVDKIMVWDTGSTDQTVELIKSIKSDKIEFKEVGLVDAAKHTQIRSKMLAETNSKDYDWLMILDGDEVWPKYQLESVIKYLNSHPKKSAIVVRTMNLVGDVYHSMPKSAGHYTIQGKTGHFGLRLINLKLPELQIINPHGGQTYVTNGTPIQDLGSDKLVLLNNYYCHVTHLPRSSADKTTLKRAFKKKLELGKRVTKKDLPEIFFSHPDSVPDVTSPMNILTYVKCVAYTLPRRLKRLIVPAKHGY